MKKPAVILVVLVSACAIIAAVMATYYSARLSDLESSQRALIVEAQVLIEEHYRIHKSYPKSLEEIRFTYPDGGDATLLTNFRYTTTGQSYSLSIKTASSNEPIEIHAQR